MTDETSRETDETTDDGTAPQTTHNEARHDADGTRTDHPTGEGQARQNAEEELPG
jgi:hypothetical protein